MPSSQLGGITDDKPVKVTIKLSTKWHRDLEAYAAASYRQREWRVKEL